MISMSDDALEFPIPEYTLLPPHTELADEPMRYDCSLCDQDVYNLSMHAQFEHKVRSFTINHEETPREISVVGHQCGINGCSFDGNHEGLHSWQIPLTSIEGDITVSSQPPLPVETPHDAD